MYEYLLKKKKDVLMRLWGETADQAALCSSSGPQRHTVSTMPVTAVSQSDRLKHGTKGKQEPVAGRGSSI